MNRFSPANLRQPAQALRPLALTVQFALASIVLPQVAMAQSKEQVLQTVVVQASADASAAGLTPDYAGGQVARGGRVGMLGNQDVMATPFSTTAYTAQLIQDQQARSVADVVQNDPTLRVARGFGNFQELYVMRGFPVPSDDMAYNGLYGLLPRQYVAAELLERVEVLRGANTFLNGAAAGSTAGGGIGGTINLLPKRAPKEALTQVTAGIENGGQFQLATDLARRFGPEERLGVRFNAVHRDGETAVKREERQLDVLALGVDYRGNAFRLSADLGYQNHRIDSPRPSVTPVGGVPGAPKAESNFAQDWTYSKERQTFGTVRGEFDLAQDVTAWFAAGLRDGREENVLANPTVNAAGVTSAYRFDNVREDRLQTAEIGVRGKFRSGSVGHTLVVSATGLQLESRNAYAMSGTFAVGNLYNPVQVAAPVANFWTGGALAVPHVTERTETSGVALADTLSFAEDRLLLTLGVRQQTIDQKTYNYNTGALESAYDKSRLTPMSAIVFKASRQVSFYANYAEALTKGDVAPATSGGLPVTNAGQALAPNVSKQKEVGVKYDAGSLGASLSLFRTEKPFGMVQNGVFSAGGEQRNQGVEINVFGEPLRGLRLLGGASFIQAKQDKTEGGAFDGKWVIGVPRSQFNLGVDWDVPGVKGLALNARAVHTAQQYADTANTLTVPSWTRFDLGARYLTVVGGQAVSFRARIDNVSNRSYWASAGGYPGYGYLVLGAPRTISLSATVDF